MRLVAVALICALFAGGCRTSSSAAQETSAVATESSKQNSPSTSPSSSRVLSPPYARGSNEAEGLSWELRLNRAQCEHSPEPSTYCMESDRERVMTESGIEQTLLNWVKDPSVDTIRLSYFTFGSSRIADALCSEAKTRSLSVEIYLQTEFVSPPEKAQGAYKKLIDCAAENPSLKVYGRGTDSWLNHAKIFLAKGQDFVRMTSSSANLSGSGISLHYDNWLFLETRLTDPIAEANLCFFDSLKGMTAADGRLDKGLFQKNQQKCAKIPQRETLRFIAVPSAPKEKRPLDYLLGLIKDAKTSITIAAHKITAPPSKNFTLVPELVLAQKRGVKIRIVFDDDTILKYKKLKGSEALNVSADEIAGYKALADAGADIRFVDTNEKIMALMHNKFMIIDSTTVFTGAGNFSSASLTGKNTEQFYIIQLPDIVSAYQKGWDELYSWAFDETHFKEPVDAEPIPTTPEAAATPAED